MILQPNPHGRRPPRAAYTAVHSAMVASKYRTVLPTEAELIAELERERRFIEQKQNGGET